MKQPLRFLQLQVMVKQDCPLGSAQVAFADFVKPMQVTFLNPRAAYGNSGIGGAEQAREGPKARARMGTDCSFW